MKLSRWWLIFFGWPVPLTFWASSSSTCSVPHLLWPAHLCIWIRWLLHPIVRELLCVFIWNAVSTFYYVTALMLLSSYKAKNKKGRQQTKAACRWECFKLADCTSFLGKPWCVGGQTDMWKWKRRAGMQRKGKQAEGWKGRKNWCREKKYRARVEVLKRVKEGLLWMQEGLHGVKRAEIENNQIKWKSEVISKCKNQRTGCPNI